MSLEFRPEICRRWDELEPAVECLNCKLCAPRCPMELDTRKSVVLTRYSQLGQLRGSHRDLFHTISKILAKSKLQAWLPNVRSDPESDLAFFAGCAPIFDLALGRDTNYSGASYSGVKILNQAGIQPHIVYRCCGHDLYYSGMLEEFEDLSQQLQAELDGKQVIAGCAECYHALRELHGLNTIHFSEFFLKIKDQLPLRKLEITTSYHDPCRLGRYHGIYDPPRRILEMISDFKEMKHVRDDAICCGVSAWLNCNSQSKQLRLERLKEALDTNANYLITSCLKCRIHLECIYFEDEYKRTNYISRIQLLDLQELIGWSLGLYDPEAGPKSFSIQAIPGAPFEPIQIRRDLRKYLDSLSLEQIFRCTTCYSCAVICPTGFQIPRMMEELRSKLVELNLNPKPHHRIAQNITQYGNPYGEPQPFPVLEVEPFDYIYFPGCTAVYRMRKIFEASRSLLDRLGVRYCMPKDIKCCGSVLLRTGQKAIATQIIEHNKRILDGAQILVSCAGCYATLKRDYKLDVIHLVELLDRYSNKLEFKELKYKVTYHDPCHYGREFQEFDHPRNLLNSITGTEFIELPNNKNNSSCCGAGGGVRAAYKDLALSLASKRMQEAKQLGVDLVLTICPFCELNLSEASPGIKVMDLSEYLLMALR